MLLSHALGLKQKKLFFSLEIFSACLLSVISIRDNSGFISFTSAQQNLHLNVAQIFPIKITDKQYSPSMNNQLWQYFRKGLNYLEASGRNYPPNFVHPGGVAYGPLALTRIAVLDVIQNCPSLSRYSTEEVFTDPVLYENFARSYADLLLRHYLRIKYWTMPAEEVFGILQKVWFLGPGLYKKGCVVLTSREERAKEYILKIAKLK